MRVPVADIAASLPVRSQTNGGSRGHYDSSVGKGDICHHYTWGSPGVIHTPNCACRIDHRKWRAPDKTAMALQLLLAPEARFCGRLLGCQFVECYHEQCLVWVSRLR